MNTHLRRHQLEQLVADDPRSPVMPVLRVHVAACDTCGTRRRALEAARVRFLAAHPPLDFARSVVEHASRPEPTAGRRWYARAGVGLAIAAITVLGLVAVVGLVLGRVPGIAYLDALRRPTGLTFEAVAPLAGGVHAVQNGDAVASGELRFVYSIERPQHLLLLGIDDGGSIAKYFPAHAAAGPLPAAERATLPITLPIGTRGGRERLYALFSDQPLDEVAARAALTRAFSSADETGAGIPAMGNVEVSARQITLWFRR